MTAAILTISDGCFHGTRIDAAGPALETALTAAGFFVTYKVIVPDEVDLIAAAIKTASGEAQFVVTTGGTGIAARDVTPEATAQVCTRLLPGFSEKMRMDGLSQTPYSILSRGICGTIPTAKGASLVLNLPGSPRGAVASLRSVLSIIPHALDLLAGRTAHREQQHRA